MLGNARGFRGDTSLIGTEAFAQDASVTQWLKDVSGPFKGTKIRYTSEATPPTVVLDKLKGEFTEATGIEVEIEIVPLEQVLAKATQDVQGQLGSYDVYYLDQSWVATFSQDTIDPTQYYKDKPDLAMPGFDWEDFSEAAGRRPCHV
jgi:multiple sugar transport system substrate-binding protein